MSIDGIDATDVVAIVTGFRSTLTTHESTINRLNVFPVPDGDTGTNMLRTVEAAVRAAEEYEGGDASGVLDAISKGSLMGARGNSGVILSQILRAIAAAAKAGPLGPEALSLALTEASDAAYAAVLRPVEGTILTVARGAAERARASSRAEGDLADVARAAREGAHDALLATPKQLPVLAEAGVVDAGGAGLVQLYESILSVITGVAVPDELVLPADVLESIASASTVGTPLTASVDAARPPGGELRYEVMFLLEAPDVAIDEFKQEWAEIGDSIVVVGGDGIFNCHIHTDDIGRSIDAAVAIGRPLEIRVTDLREQVGELEAQAGGDHDEAGPGDEFRNPAVTSVVAVASGAGVASILRSLGVAQIVGGGQSMNPSTEELLAGIGAAVSREVLVLPNNSNIIPVAHQAAKLAGRAVVVVPTTTIQEGIAALVAYDPGAPAEANASRMVTAVARVTSGEVTRAARDAVTEVGEVAEGSWIGLTKRGVVAKGDSCADAAAALVDALATDEHEILTVIEGADAPIGAVEALLAQVAEHHPGLCVEHHLGGQPVYPILLALE